MEVSCQFHALAALTPGTRGWVGPRASLDVVAKMKNPCPCQHPAHSLVTIQTELTQFPCLTLYSANNSQQSIIITSTPKNLYLQCKTNAHLGGINIKEVS